MAVIGSARIPIDLLFALAGETGNLILSLRHPLLCGTTIPAMGGGLITDRPTATLLIKARCA